MEVRNVRTGNKNFRDRMRLVQRLGIRTITEGWKEGLGPSDKPYWMCCAVELLGVGEAAEAPFKPQWHQTH
jgi:hypothetical protein